MSVFLNVLWLELRRCATSRRCVPAAMCVLLAYASASPVLGSIASIRGDGLPGRSALDCFFVALNTEAVTSLLMPLGALFLGADMFSKDCGPGGLLGLLRSKTRSATTLFLGKVAALWLVCLAYTLFVAVFLTLADMAFAGSPLSAKPSDWLAYSGDPADYLWNVNGYRLALIPRDWNYALLVIFLVLVCSACLAAFVLLGAGVALALAPRMNPLMLCGPAILIMQMIPSIASNLHFLLNPNEPFFDWGFLADRFCLAYYCLGASVGQSEVGQRALRLLADEQNIYLGTSSFTAVNTPAALIALVCAMTVIGLVLLAFAWRKNCTGGVGTK